MDSFSWLELLKLESNHCILHHTGYLARVARVAPCRYEDGEIELRFDGGPLNLLYLNYRAQLEHHVFYRWLPHWPSPKFRAGDRVWRRGDAIDRSHEVAGISPIFAVDGRGQYRYYLNGSRALYPETCLVLSPLTT